MWRNTSDRQVPAGPVSNFKTERATTAFTVLSALTSADVREQTAIKNMEAASGD
jgi:hypothetical protein